MQKTYTYGVLPGHDDFMEAYKQVVGDGPFEVRNDKWVGNETYDDGDDLYDAVVDAHDAYHIENAIDGDIALEYISNVLTVLGFEWI